MNGRPWGLDELTEALRDDLPVKAIARHLGRTVPAVWSIRKKANQQGTEVHRALAMREARGEYVRPITLDEHDAYIKRCNTCGTWVYGAQACRTCRQGPMRGAA